MNRPYSFLIPSCPGTPVANEHSFQLRRLPLAPDEGVRLINQVVRAILQRGQRRELVQREIRMVKLVKMLRLRQIAQMMRPQVGKFRAVHIFAGVRSHGLRHKRLPRMAHLHDARRAV